MAIYKASGLILDVTGSIGQVTFTRINGKLIAKKKLVRTDANTIAQNTQRDFFISSIALWNLLPQCIKNDWEQLASGDNRTGFDNFQSETINALKADSYADTTPAGTLPALTTFYTERPAWGVYTYLYYEPADLVGTEKLYVIAQQRGVYGNTGKILFWEIAQGTSAPVKLSGMGDTENFRFYGIKLDNTIATAIDYSPQETFEQGGGEVTTPIGGIIAWHKSLAGCPALPIYYVECNGQVLADADSPFNGKTIPDLNGGKRFLRGGAASGTLEADTTAVNGLTAGNESAHTHAIDHDHPSGTTGSNASGTTATTHTQHRHESQQTSFSHGAGTVYHNSVEGTKQATTSYETQAEHGTHTHSFDVAALTQASGAGSAHSHGLSGDSETRPDNMSVVWVMRIK